MSHTFASELLHAALIQLLDRTVALGVDALGLAQLPALVALGNWPAFLLDFEEGPIGMTARRRAMSLYTRFTRSGSIDGRLSVEKYTPSVFPVIDKHLGE